MKQTKAGVEKKSKKAKVSVKRDKDNKPTVTVEKVPANKDNKELLATVKTLVTQNKDMMASLSSPDNSEAMFKHIGDLVVGLRDLSLKDSQDAQILQKAERPKKWVAKITKRDNQGYIDTFVFEQELGALN